MIDSDKADFEALLRGIAGVIHQDLTLGSNGTIHPDPGAAMTQPDTPAGDRPVVTRRDRRVAFAGVSGVGGLELVGIDLRRRISNPTSGLELPDSTTQCRSDQPVAGRHRPTTSQYGRVADHHRLAMVVTDHDVEFPLGCSPQQSFHPLMILRRGDHVMALRGRAPGSR